MGGLQPKTEGDMRRAHNLVAGYLKRFKVSVRSAGRGTGREWISVWGLLRALRNEMNTGEVEEQQAAPDEGAGGRRRGRQGTRLGTRQTGRQRGRNIVF